MMKNYNGYACILLFNSYCRITVTKGNRLSCFEWGFENRSRKQDFQNYFVIDIQASFFAAKRQGRRRKSFARFIKQLNSHDYKTFNSHTNLVSVPLSRMIYARNTKELRNSSKITLLSVCVCLPVCLLRPFFLRNG